MAAGLGYVSNLQSANIDIDVDLVKVEIWSTITADAPSSERMVGGELARLGEKRGESADESTDGQVQG